MMKMTLGSSLLLTCALWCAFTATSSAMTLAQAIAVLKSPEISDPNSYPTVIGTLATESGFNVVDNVTKMVSGIQPNGELGAGNWNFGYTKPAAPGFDGFTGTFYAPTPTGSAGFTPLQPKTYIGSVNFQVQPNDWIFATNDYKGDTLHGNVYGFMIVVRDQGNGQAAVYVGESAAYIGFQGGGGGLVLELGPSISIPSTASQTAPTGYLHVDKSMVGQNGSVSISWSVTPSS